MTIRKILIGVVMGSMLLTACSKEEAHVAVDQVVAVSDIKEDEPAEEIQIEVSSEEIMKRIDTSNIDESVPIPDNFPISYFPIIDGAQIVEGISERGAGGTNFTVTQRVNLVPEDAYKYYSDLYIDSPSYQINEYKTGELLKIERAKNGLKAVLTFIADEEGSSQIVMEIATGE